MTQLFMPLQVSPRQGTRAERHRVCHLMNHMTFLEIVTLPPHEASQLEAT